MPNNQGLQTLTPDMIDLNAYNEWRQHMERRRQRQLEEQDINNLFYKRHELNVETGRMNQVLQCIRCPANFKKRCNAIDHARTHVNERPFVCRHCGMQFT